MNKNLSTHVGNYDRRTCVPSLVAKAAAGTTGPTSVLSRMEPMRDVIAAYGQHDLGRPGWIEVELRPAT